MSPLNALLVVTWAAIIVLFLGLAAVLREVRLLRAAVARDTDGFSAARPELSLGPAFTGLAGVRIVLAADSGCPLCLQVAERLGQLARAAGTPADHPAAPVLLTHEPAAAWADAAASLRVISDRDAWRTVSHLSPPVLMLVDGAGQVVRLVLPVRAEETDEVWRSWRDSLTKEEEPGGIGARGNS